MPRVTPNPEFPISTLSLRKTICVPPSRVNRWITILTAMFMHGSWSHILENMVLLWAFGPEVEDAMNPIRYLAFHARADRAQPQLDGSEPGRKWSNCRGDGRMVLNRVGQLLT
jgi:Rhomboid family